MKRFKISGEFMATDIDDAMDFLARHFRRAAAGELSDSERELIFMVVPVEDEKAEL